MITSGVVATLLLGLSTAHLTQPAQPAQPVTITVSAVQPIAAKKHCGPLEIDCKISNALDGWFRDLAKSAIKTVFNGLGKNLIQTPRIDQIPWVGEIWDQVHWVANTCFVLFVIIGGLLVMGYETVQTSTTVKDVARSLVIAAIAGNFSLPVVGHAIEFANGLSLALIGPGADAEEAMRTLGRRLSANLATGPLFLVLLVLVAVTLALLLAVVYALRHRMPCVQPSRPCPRRPALTNEGAHP
ncbi:hypothetical protein ACRYCC_10210 [Actinomadura scrupuli]|uniref:hypothetical protein n=1 Tax=Actinomadura scrupuli TaxID=559629 RepID=UPI003D99C9EE